LPAVMHRICTGQPALEHREQESAGQQESVAMFPWRNASCSVQLAVASEICVGRLAEAEALIHQRCGTSMFRTCRPGKKKVTPEPKQIVEATANCTEQQGCRETWRGFEVAVLNVAASGESLVHRIECLCR